MIFEDLARKEKNPFLGMGHKGDGVPVKGIHEARMWRLNLD
jgi:hypothetical protein